MPPFPPSTMEIGRPFHQHDVLTDASDGVPGDALIRFPAEQSKKTPPSGHHQCYHLSTVQIHLHVAHKAEPAAVRHADHFLIPKLRDPRFLSRLKGYFES